MPTWDISDTLPPFSGIPPDQNSHHPESGNLPLPVPGARSRTGILQIFFRQFTTAVYYNFITHIIYLHMIDCSYSKLCLRKSHSANAALNSYNYFHFLKPYYVVFNTTYNNTKHSVRKAFIQNIHIPFSADFVYTISI